MTGNLLNTPRKRYKQCGEKPNGNGYVNWIGYKRFTKLNYNNGRLGSKYYPSTLNALAPPNHHRIGVTKHTTPTPTVPV
jgi:hypothetical protein